MKAKFSPETHTPLLTYSVRQNRYAKTFRCCLVALGLLVASQLAADADTILGYNTTYPFPQAGPEVDTTFASSFTVGPNDIEITSMQFLIEGVYSQPNETTAYIFADSAGQPGAVVESSHRSFAINELYNDTYNGGFTTYTFVNPVILSAGSIYWAGFGNAGASVGLLYISYTYNLNEFATYGVTPSLSFATSGSYPPDQFTVNAPTQTLVYQLEGSVVPEPAPVVLMFLGFATSTIRRMRKQPE